MKNIDLKSRGAGINTQNRFEPISSDYTDDYADDYIDPDEEPRKIQTKFYNDDTKSILAKNDSPDLAFD